MRGHGIGILAGLLAAVAIATACGRSHREAGSPRPAPEPGAGAADAAYAGSSVCSECHREEAALWRESDHALAMQEATPATVLGDFGDRRVTAQGVTSTFTRRDGGFAVRTDGADGRLAEFKIAYTFGVRPLQQYLIEFPRGRYQALGLAWDSRPRARGGQRWFHLYAGERVDHRDALHWTSPEQNWNYMCAECHSTDLRRRYDAAGDQYATAWVEIEVACEACHGPGSSHVAWARAGAHGPGGPGLAVRFPPLDPSVWAFDGTHPTARRAAPAASDAALETCGRCHSRRGWVWEEVTPGDPLAQTHRVVALDAELYYDDGQILGEVYEYGSFLQSRMQRAGVTCSDCHDPHSGRPHAAGNALCSRCHQPSHFDAPAHHHHAAGSAGAQCVSCHMPERVYMAVDPRRDHSLRVPRPDLSVSLKTPDACASCHAGRDARWAAAAVAGWFPSGRSGTPHFGRALHAARTGGTGAVPALLAVVADADQADIVRATALAALPHSRATRSGPGPATGLLAAIARAAVDRSHFVRRAAAEWLEPLPAEAKARLGAPLLDDPVRTVRLAAAVTFAGSPPALLGEAGAAALRRDLEEYRMSLAFNADRADANFNLGNLERSLGRPSEAEAAYRRASTLDPTFVPAAVNLADLFSTTGRDAEGEAILKQSLARNRESPDLEHALGLARVRQGDARGALAHLRRAADLRPNDARYSYVYAVALHDTGDPAGAIAVLEKAAARNPGDADIAGGLVSYYGERGDRASAERWTRRLRDLEQTP